LLPYSHLAIAPIQFYGEPFEDPSEREATARIGEAINQALKQELAKDYEVVAPSEVRQNQLLICVAITQVKSTQALVNVATTAVVGLPISRGGLKAELEAVDALTGARIAAMSWAGDAPLLTVRPSEIVGSFTRYRQAEARAQEFASSAAELLAKAPPK
jgi:hypothetical protein